MQVCLRLEGRENTHHTPPFELRLKFLLEEWNGHIAEGNSVHSERENHS
jgi:hypothetical protein